MNQIGIAEFANATMQNIAHVVAQCFAGESMKVERFNCGSSEGIMASNGNAFWIIVIGPDGMGQWRGNLAQLCDRADVWKAVAEAATTQVAAAVNARDEADRAAAASEQAGEVGDGE